MILIVRRDKRTKYSGHKNIVRRTLTLLSDFSFARSVYVERLLKVYIGVTGYDERFNQLHLKHLELPDWGRKYKYE